MNGLHMNSKVKIVKCSCQWKNTCYGTGCVGKTGVVKSLGIINKSIEVEFDDQTGHCGFKRSEIIVIWEGSMSKHKELESRIYSMSKHTTIEEADSILDALRGDKWMEIRIAYRQNGGGKIVARFFQKAYTCYEVKETFEYDNKCEKLHALQDAYLWFLSVSDVSKIARDKDRKIMKLKDVVTDKRIELMEAERVLREVESN